MLVEKPAALSQRSSKVYNNNQTRWHTRIYPQKREREAARSKRPPKTFSKGLNKGGEGSAASAGPY
jgi:hypothetical protein